MKSANRRRLPAKYGERAQTAAALALGKRGRKIEAKWKSEADRSESAIGVLRNALGMCKSEADRSESAIGVLKTCPKPLAGTRGTPANVSRHRTKISNH